FRFDGGNTIEVVLQWLGARFFDGTFVHAAGIVIADLLLVGAPARPVDRRLFENVAHNVFAALLQFVEAAPGRAVGGNRVLRLPLAARVGVKIVAWIHALIEQVGGEAHVGGRLRGFSLVLGRLVLRLTRDKQHRNGPNISKNL